MQTIDPAILEMIENGRAAVATRHEKKAEADQVQRESEHAKWDQAWDELETAVAQQLPAEIAKYALSAREHNVMPGVHSVVTVGIEHLHPFNVMFTKEHGGWHLRYFFIKRRTVTHEVDKYFMAEFKSNELHLCLAEVARLTEWRTDRKRMQLDYEIAVAEWRKAHDEAQATITAMTQAMQKQVCDHYGDRFGLWQILYSYFDEEGGTETNTAVVLENETDALGFWRVVNRMGEVRRIAFSSVYAIEALGDHDVTDGEYTKRLYGDKLGTIYLPPYVTDAELAAAKKMLAEADAAAPDLPEQPRPHEMETAVLFAEWELDWLDAHNQGGDADN